MLPWHARSVIDTFHTLQDHKTDKYGQTVEHPSRREPSGIIAGGAAGASRRFFDELLSDVLHQCLATLCGPAGGSSK